MGPRHCGWPDSQSAERQPDVPGARDDEAGLLSIAESVVAMAAPGEEIEVVVAHERETEVRAYEAEIESLTSSESRGIGVRVCLLYTSPSPRDKRQSRMPSSA